MSIDGLKANRHLITSTNLPKLNFLILYYILLSLTILRDTAARNNKFNTIVFVIPPPLFFRASIMFIVHFRVMNLSSIT